MTQDTRRYEHSLSELLSTEWDLWEHDCIVNAELGMEALRSSPAVKTCGRDGLVGESWRGIAWASNMRLERWPPAPAPNGPAPANLAAWQHKEASDSEYGSFDNDYDETNDRGDGPEEVDEGHDRAVQRGCRRQLTCRGRTATIDNAATTIVTDSENMHSMHDIK